MKATPLRKPRLGKNKNCLILVCSFPPLNHFDSKVNLMMNPKPYLNPYLAGIGLGLVLLSAFVIMGRGLGASGAFTSVLAAGVNSVAPSHAQSNGLYKEYLNTPSGNPLKEWLVYEIAGVLVGGFISGLLSGRIKRTVEKSPGFSTSGRLVYAFSGGILLGFSSKSCSRMHKRPGSYRRGAFECWQLGIHDRRFRERVCRCISLPETNG